MKARFKVLKMEHLATGDPSKAWVEVIMIPQNPTNAIRPSAVNERWSLDPLVGRFSMVITNPDEVASFDLEGTYDLTFSLVDPLELLAEEEDDELLDEIPAT